MRRFLWLSVGALLLASIAVASSGGATQAETRWVVTDLGAGEAFAINSRGQIVGSAVKGGMTQPFVWANGEKTLLPGLDGRKEEGAAYAISDRGVIAGRSSYRAVAWLDHKVRDLGALPGFSPERYRYTPKVINSRGTIVGTVEWRTDDMTDMERAFVYRQGKMVGVGDQSSIGAQLSSWYFTVDALLPTSDFVGACCALSDSHAFVWRNGRVVRLPVPPRTVTSAATAVNEQGTVVGYSVGVGATVTRALVWRDARLQRLPIPSGLPTGANSHCQAEGINNAGDIVGYCFWSPRYRPVLWRGGRAIRIGPPDSRAFAINERGQVLIQGYVTRESHYGDRYAYLWDSGKLTKLPALGEQSRVFAINESDQIIGSSDTKSGQTHAVLWTLKRG